MIKIHNQGEGVKSIDTKWILKEEEKETCEAFEVDGIAFLSSKNLTKLLHAKNMHMWDIMAIKVHRINCQAES
jgi:hypothetical protein